MCGRFVSASPPDELARYFGASVLDESLATGEAGETAFEPRFNVAPSATVLAVLERDDPDAGLDRRVGAVGDGVGEGVGCGFAHREVFKLTGWVIAECPVIIIRNANP